LLKVRMMNARVGGMETAVREAKQPTEAQSEHKRDQNHENHPARNGDGWRRPGGPLG
jgi:hypothetical protein